MFGKKKESGIPVGHYEGIEGFATDYPCRIEVKVMCLRSEESSLKLRLHFQ